MRALAWLLALTVLLTAPAAERSSGPLPAKVDLNNASKEALETLPGVGPVLAQEIMRARPFRVIDDLDKVKGIGPKKLEKIRPRVYITAMAARPPPRLATNTVTRVNLNTASQPELEKLPGIGPKRAEAIIAARPFKRPEDLLRISGFKRAQYEMLKDRVTVR